MNDEIEDELWFRRQLKRVEDVLKAMKGKECQGFQITDEALWNGRVAMIAAVAKTCPGCHRNESIIDGRSRCGRFRYLLCKACDRRFKRPAEFLTSGTRGVSHAAGGGE